MCLSLFPREKKGTGENCPSPVRGSVILGHCRNRLLQRVHGDVRFLFAYDERRRHANSAWPASQEQNAPLESKFNDAVAFGRAIFLRLLVLDDLNPNHQAAAANIAYQ